MRRSTALTGLRKFLYLIFLLLAVLILLEILLRWTGVYLLYSEVNGGHFLIEYDRSYENGHRFTHKPDQPIIYSNGEFEFICKANELGYRDRPINNILSRAKSKNLVLFIGDSFIEGVGADCFQSMPHQFEQLYNSDSLVIVNAGISGSDVFYEYKLLESDLPRLRPDLILLGLNHTDIYEYVTRGGFERFLPDERVEHRRSPVNVLRYRQSHLYRWYVHEICRKTRYTFLTRKELAAQEKLAESEIPRVLQRIDSLANVFHTQLVVFIYPVPTYLYGGEPEPVLERLHSNCTKNGIKSLLLTQDFEQLADYMGANFDTLFWPVDGHYRNSGYGEFAKILKKRLNE